MGEPFLSAHEYDVAVSYASEDRPYVHEFVAALKTRGLRVFYDLDEEELLWGADLPELFLEVFQRKARTAVIFISQDYVKKPWPRHEGRTVIGRAIVEHSTYFLPVRIDDSELAGMRPGIGYVRTNDKSPDELADLVVQKLATLADERCSNVTLDAPRSPAEVRTTAGDAALVNAVADGEPLYLVMDLGGTKAYVALMTEDATQLYAKRFMTESQDDSTGLLSFIRQCVRGPLDRIHELTGLRPDEVAQRIAAIGIAFPGPTDSEKGLVLDASNFKIKNFPLAQRIEETFGIPTYIDNDVNLGALGETWKGAAQGYQNVVGIMIGTGIGGGLILHGEIYRGRNRTAGEIGHMVLDLDSDVQCGCGQFGCFEALASRSAMARELHRRKAGQGLTDRLWAEKNLLSNEIAYYYNQGDIDAVAVVNRAAEICGKAIFTILNLFNPDIIVLNGGFVFQLNTRFLAPILHEANKCMNAVYSLDDNKIPIVIGALANPVLFGACRMAIQGSGRATEPGRQDILAAVARGLAPDDYEVLGELYRLAAAAPINRHPNGDYHEDKLRPLRDRGLVRLDGRSFRKSSTVEITDLGRIAYEEQSRPLNTTGS